MGRSGPRHFATCRRWLTLIVVQVSKCSIGVQRLLSIVRRVFLGDTRLCIQHSVSLWSLHHGSTICTTWMLCLGVGYFYVAYYVARVPSQVCQYSFTQAQVGLGDFL